MKRFVIAIVALWQLGNIATLQANVPVGGTIYLDARTYWQGATCYLVHSSSNNYTYLMKATSTPGIYSYTATKAINQNNLNFGKGKTAVTADFSGWFGSYVSVNKETPNSGNIWTASTPMWVLSDEQGNGSWQAMPSTDRLTNVSYEVTETSCAAQTYTVEVTASLSGSTATLKIEGDLLSSTRLITNCATPYTMTLTMDIEEGSTGHDLSFSACADAAGTSVNNSMTLHIAQPTLKCQTDSTIEVCDSLETTTLTAQTEGDSLQWKKGTTLLGQTQSISVSTRVNATYTAEIYENYVNPDNNLMVNGDFESGYSDFTSDFTPITKNGTPVVNPVHVYSNNYDNGSEYGHYYMITNNAEDIQDGVGCSFYPIHPHGGEEFLLVDANAAKYAWKTSTAQSPKLQVTQGEWYIFSYWVAIPNMEPELSGDPRARLDFKIELNIGGIAYSYELDTFKVGSLEPLYDWHQRSIRWQAPYTCNNVTIGVKDVETSSAGNDFCLDDIIFQPEKSAEKRLKMTENYTIVSQECKRPEPEPEPCQNLVYAKWNNVLFVNNGATGLDGKAQSYQWYKDDQLLPGETKQYYYADMSTTASYHATVVLLDGTKVTTCSKTFGNTDRSAVLNPGDAVVTRVAERIFILSPHIRVVQTIYSDGSTDARKEVWL